MNGSQNYIMFGTYTIDEGVQKVGPNIIAHSFESAERIVVNMSKVIGKQYFVEGKFKAIVVTLPKSMTTVPVDNIVWN